MIYRVRGCFAKEDQMQEEESVGLIPETSAPQKLLRHVVKGEEAEALKMIAENPRLLLIESEVQDYSGRTIKGTAFQAALGALDTVMAEKMLPYFEGLEEGAAKKQFKHQFPLGWEATVEKLKQSTYEFKPLIDAIISGDHDEALAHLKEAITPKDTINAGVHFNPYCLMHAYAAYCKHYDSMHSWEHKCTFWGKVIGFMQSQFPANLAQSYCSGLNSYGNFWIEPHRKLTMVCCFGVEENDVHRYCDNKHFYDKGLGEVYAFYNEKDDSPSTSTLFSTQKTPASDRKRAVAVCEMDTWAVFQDLKALNNLMKRKGKAIQKIEKRLNNPIEFKMMNACRLLR